MRRTPIEIVWVLNGTTKRKQMQKKMMKFSMPEHNMSGISNHSVKGFYQYGDKINVRVQLYVVLLWPESMI